MAALTFDDITPGGVPRGPNGLPRVVITTGTEEAGSKALTFDDITTESGTDTALRYAKDAGLSLLSGLDKGVAGLAGLPADLALGINAAVNYGKAKVQGRSFDDVEAESDRNGVISREAVRKWGSQAAHAGSPLKHDPETTAGKYIQSAAEFIPSSLLGPGSIARNVLGLGVLPGLASEAAGQATEGTQYEPYARAGAAVAGGVLGHWATAPNAAGSTVTRATRGATPAQIDQAEQLFQYAQQQGIPITRAEAVQYVTNGGTNLGNLQRVVEGQGGLRQFMATRPGQVDAAARREFDALGPLSPTPNNIGPQVGQTADGIIQDVTGAINRASRPYYQAAEHQRVGRQVFNNNMANDPLFAQTLAEVRNNPALNRTIAHLPDDSVGVIDLVQRRMREQAENVRLPGQANTSNLAAANFEDARHPLIAAADAVTGSRPGVAGSYEAARNIQTQLRGQYLEPIMNGPIGKMAGRDTPTKRAIEVLFPSNPLPNSEQEVAQAVAALAHRNRPAATQLVRAHAEMTFNEATQRLQAGLNEFGGAGFAAIIRGNPQQAANLEAAVTALRGGQAWQGFDRFLQVLEAQGNRQRIGSQTAFNQEVQAGLKNGGTVGEALSGVATGGLKLPSRIMQRIEQWRMGRNVNEIADILTNPAAAALFRQLATAPAGSRKATEITARLIYLGTRGREQ